MSRDLKLINLVRENKCLYDINSDNYNNKDLKILIWNRIAKELGMKFTRTKIRWKTFRDRYARELRNTNEGESSDSSYPAWKYFNDLGFLKEFIAQRNQKGNRRGGKWDVGSDELAEERKLISLIRERKWLYDKKGKYYKGTKVIWEELAQEMKKSVPQVRIRWKSLRDKYVREKKIFENNRSNKNSSWVLYEDMDFLRDYVQAKQPTEEDEEISNDNSESYDDSMLPVKEEEELEALEASKKADVNPIPCLSPNVLDTANDNSEQPEEPMIEVEFAEVPGTTQKEAKPETKTQDLTSSYISIIENKLRRFPEQQCEEIAMEVITLINKKLYSNT